MNAMIQPDLTCATPLASAAIPASRTQPGLKSRRRPLGILVNLFDMLLTWQDRARERHALASMEDRMLQDIGLDQATAGRETEKPFWMA